MDANSLAGKIPASVQELFLAAREAREFAYSPYSRIKVGAAVRARGGRIYTGANIENSSYGATICAERVAIHNAVSRGDREICEVLVLTDAAPPWPPCGLCRQVIAEFGAHATIHMANLAGEIRAVELEEIFPQAFTPDRLPLAGT